MMLSLLSKYERAQHENKNCNWTESLSSVLEMPSAVSFVGNKLVKRDKEYLVNLELKIDDITKGLDKAWSKKLREGLSPENAEVICNYIISMRTEINPADNYRRDSIKMPYLLSTFLENKPFEEVTRNDVINFLDSFRKLETLDPLHKWIGTYNLYLVRIIRFIKWLYYPDIEHKKRPKPKIVQNISALRRKEKSIYKPTDMWTEEDDLLFCRYCPSKRDKAYHMIARDTSARPHEILYLKIKSVIWNRTYDGKIYANVLVNGKTGSRSLLLTDSIPYLKDYLNTEHPMPNSMESPLICGTGKSLGRRVSGSVLGLVYSNYKKKVFPNILNNNHISEEDKHRLQNLLLKPWNPYIRRHSSLTQKSKILKEHTLRQYAGWTPNSGMPQKYVHYFGDEANQDLLTAYGIISKDGIVDTALRTRYCPNCNSPNQPEQHYCMSCGFVLTLSGYSKLMDEQKKKEDQLLRIEEKYEQEINSIRKEMENKFQQILAKIDIVTLK
jgi:integrase/recombinase XerD